jgi:hypothetical protein
LISVEYLIAVVVITLEVLSVGARKSVGWKLWKKNIPLDFQINGGEMNSLRSSQRRGIQLAATDHEDWSFRGFGLLQPFFDIMSNQATLGFVVILTGHYDTDPAW